MSKHLFCLKQLLNFNQNLKIKITTLANAVHPIKVLPCLHFCGDFLICTVWLGF